ncbi:MAG: hypothetical protein GPOALKHO_001102 [Sodalis sp.]|uniref:hypothetical protein n=1 Tax=Sodalis sp. (in: enterobacteria) TaxID=1898979 RepID=UPI0038736227|nr:MAG: hypothetical protein GPOALKHO_001102 [Sodalis sp.]
MFEINDPVVRYSTGNLLSRFKLGAVRYVDILAGQPACGVGKDAGLTGEAVVARDPYRMVTT